MTDFQTYLDLEGVNWSTLKHFYKSPAHVKSYLEKDRAETEATRRGTWQHLAILEPDVLAEKAIAMPDFGDGRTKAAKEAKSAFESEHEGKDIIPSKTFHELLGMSKAVWSHPEAKALLKAVTEVERPIQWTDTGVKCKGLVDMMTTKGIICDLKTTDDCRSFKFARKAADFAYFEQATYYLRGCRAMGLKFDAFCWIVVESAAPFAVRVYTLRESDKIACENVIDAFLAKWNYCTQCDAWPAYTDGMEDLEIPDYKLTNMERQL
jgi:exodeoxyribonuclease VIII